MKRFHHPGRFGDCIYALYTVKSLGGGSIYMSEFHTPAWGFEEIKSLLPLLSYQSYIDSAMCFIAMDDELDRWRNGLGKPKFIIDNIDYDLHDAENDRNPEKFPEWNGNVWPGNCHIAKRYSVHYGIEFDFESKWLEAPINSEGYDIVFHSPLRRTVRKKVQWVEILSKLSEKYKIAILSGKNDSNEWQIDGIQNIIPSNFLITAEIINSSKLFLGSASSCNVIAEALKKERVVELASDCFNTYPYGLTGTCANGYNVDEIIKIIGEKID